jgi:serine/threonine protein kinase
MAPEQARGEAMDCRADLFGLGSTLYVMCTGLPPFQAASALAVLRRVCEEQPAPPATLNPVRRFQKLFSGRTPGLCKNRPT